MTSVEKTFNMSLSSDAHAQPYPCLAEASTPPDTAATRELAKTLLDQYANQKLSLKRWRKAPHFRISWTDTESKPPVQRQSVLLRLDWLVDHLVKHRRLDHSLLNLCPPEKSQRNWMDADLTLFGHYAPCNQAPESLKIRLPLSLGNVFPVVPAIDREGFATSSPQLHLQRGLLAARNRVIRESPALVPQVIDRDLGQHAQLMIGRTPPIAALMEFATLFVTIVDITLMQAYYAARYAPNETGLTFDKNKIGAATGRTMDDKLRWVMLLSGNALHAQEELAVFRQMKALRNHLTHFDPPCLAVSIDDVAGWLSNVPALAWLLIKIRLCLGVPVSSPLVEMAMLPPVLAVPRDSHHPRHPLSNDAGYASSTWGREHPHRGHSAIRVSERLAARFEPISNRATRVLGREVAVGEIVGALLASHADELDALSDADLEKRMRGLMKDSG
jgi:hypothetical protein